MFTHCQLATLSVHNSPEFGALSADEASPPYLQDRTKPPQTWSDSHEQYPALIYSATVQVGFLEWLLQTRGPAVSVNGYI